MNKKSYNVSSCLESFVVDADWDKPFWQNVVSLEINDPHWPVQSDFFPKVEVKLQYDTDNLYAIFKVQDKYVQALATQTHDPVCQDSCVEFFFAPSGMPEGSYFNLEVNCCGVLLMSQHDKPRDKGQRIELADCQKIAMASSLSGTIEKEISEPLTWTVEYALPFEILCKYTACEAPTNGVVWQANFYKCADESSHPHWLAWSPIAIEKPDFHRPDFFGKMFF